MGGLGGSGGGAGIFFYEKCVIKLILNFASVFAAASLFFHLMTFSSPWNRVNLMDASTTADADACLHTPATPTPTPLITLTHNNNNIYRGHSNCER